MTFVEARKPPLAVQRLDPGIIQSRLAACSVLPSLRSTHGALHELLHVDEPATQQIAEVIRRDPSLTIRVLRLANSAYYGFSTPIVNLEEAVYYVGLHQVRRIALATPLLEDVQAIGDEDFSWREFWLQSLATAILSQQLVSSLGGSSDGTAYLAGLTHDVGRLVLARVFPDHFQAIHEGIQGPWEDLPDHEERILGIDHAELGALFLRTNKLPAVFVVAARSHHDLGRAGETLPIAAAVQIAVLAAQHSLASPLIDSRERADESWETAAGWDVLLPRDGRGRSQVQAGFKQNLKHLPDMLEGLI